MKLFFVSIFLCCSNFAFAAEYFHLVDGKTYYELLGVRPDASKNELKSKRKALAKQYHTDRPDGNHEVISQINNAFDILIDDNKRLAYDKWLRGLNQNSSQSNGGTKPKSKHDLRVEILDYIVKRIQISIREHFYFYPNTRWDYIFYLARKEIFLGQTYFENQSIQIDDLYYLIKEYALSPFVYKAYDETTMVALAVAGYILLEEYQTTDHRAKGFLLEIQNIFADTLRLYGPNSDRSLYIDKIWKVLFGKSYFYKESPAPNQNYSQGNSCSTLLTEAIYTDAYGRQWRIPIQVSIKFGH